MPFTHTVSRQYIDRAGELVAGTEQVTADAEINLDVTLAQAANQEIDWAAVRSKLRTLVLKADAAVTIYSNAASGGAPDDTIALAAGQAKVWTLAQDLVAKCPFSVDVTKLYITVPGAAGATVKIRALAAL